MIGQEKAESEDNLAVSVLAALAVWGAIFIYLVADKASARKHHGCGILRGVRR